MDVKKAVLQGYSDRIALADGSMGSEAVHVCRMNAYDPKLLSKGLSLAPRIDANNLS